MEQIRPDIPCGAVDAAARAVMAAAGYGDGYELFTHRLGHGIGLEVHEPPYLVRDNPLVLRPGMTMSNEPGLYVPGDFGIRIEDIVAVTADGVEIFGPPIGPFEDPFANHHRPA
jgi:Xaa-Pro dipeptidase